MSQKAAENVYKSSGLSPKDFQVVELHDCFSAHELILYEALGLCKPGNQLYINSNYTFSTISSYIWVLSEFRKWNQKK